MKQNEFRQVGSLLSRRFLSVHVYCTAPSAYVLAQKRIACLQKKRDSNRWNVYKQLEADQIMQANDDFVLA